MKKFNNKYWLILSVAIFFLSCSSNDDSNIIIDDTKGKGILSLGVTPMETYRSMETGEVLKNHSDCSNLELKYIRMALRDKDGNCYYGNSKSGFHELEMDPSGLDTNNDGIIDTWSTSQKHKFLLPAGDYTLEYLAVTDNPGVDSKIVFMSPRRSEVSNPTQYYNLVEISVPITFSIQDGLEKNILLQTLCFQKEHAYQFGLFFVANGDSNPFSCSL